jgi:hypothetical protein
MKKGELFPLILACIGLLADIISIGAFVLNAKAGNNIGDLFQQTFFVNLAFFLVLYSWLILSWFMIRRNYKASISRGILQRRIPIIRNAIISFGVITLPFTILIAYIASNFWLLVIHLLNFPLLYFLLYMLMPLVYEEMRVFITRIGDYVSKTRVYLNFGEILIEEGERISVIKNYGINEPEKYFFQKGNKGGYLLYTDLISNFKVSKAAKRNID